MRLNPFNPGSVNVGRSGGGGFPGGGAGGVGCGTQVLAALGYFIFGADPMQTIGMVEGAQQSLPAEQQGAPAEPTGGQSAEEVCGVNPYSMETCNALGSLNQTWEPVFAQAGIEFRQPRLHFIEGGGVNTGCGGASSAMGPFYCPADQTIYIDTAFYDQLNRQLGAGPGDFARYYVIAHEYGHHVQTITGVSDSIRSAQNQNPRQANQLQVLMELQADCYAGVWAGKNRNAIEPGDFEEGMQAASAIGDDALTGGRGNPESFTHGTSAQRMQALRLGLESGDDRQCDRIVNVG